MVDKCVFGSYNTKKTQQAYKGRRNVMVKVSFMVKKKTKKNGY